MLAGLREAQFVWGDTCSCPPSVEMGSYDRQITVNAPNGARVGIDVCIHPDIERLWSLGVMTIESCCGHGRTAGYIAVDKRSAAIMRALGFKTDPRTDNLNIFLWPWQESPLAVGKLHACFRICNEVDAGADIILAAMTMQKIVMAHDWRWADILRSYLDALSHPADTAGNEA